MAALCVEVAHPPVEAGQDDRRRRDVRRRQRRRAAGRDSHRDRQPGGRGRGLSRRARRAGFRPGGRPDRRLVRRDRQSREPDLRRRPSGDDPRRRGRPRAVRRALCLDAHASAQPEGHRRAHPAVPTGRPGGAGPPIGRRARGAAAASPSRLIVSALGLGLGDPEVLAQRLADHGGSRLMIVFGALGSMLRVALAPGAQTQRWRRLSLWVVVRHGDAAST